MALEQIRVVFDCIPDYAYGVQCGGIVYTYPVSASTTIALGDADSVTGYLLDGSTWWVEPPPASPTPYQTEVILSGAFLPAADCNNISHAHDSVYGTIEVHVYGTFDGVEYLVGSRSPTWSLYGTDGADVVLVPGIPLACTQFWTNHMEQMEVD